MSSSRSYGNKDKQMKISKGYSFRACYNKGVSNHHLYLVETQMQSKKVGKLYNAKNVKL